MMEIRPYRSQKGKCLRLFVGEAEEWHGKPLSQTLVEIAWHYGIREVAVLRGIEGFGPEHHISTERLIDLSENLPLIVEMVDNDERIGDLLPELDRFMRRGMMTMTSVAIILEKE